MELVQQEFRIWLENNTNLADRSLQNYVGAIKTISNWLDTDMTKIRNKLEFEEFIKNCSSNSTFNERDRNGNRMYSVALNHYKNFLEFKEVDEIVQLDEEENMKVMHTLNCDHISPDNKANFSYDNTPKPVGEVNRIVEGTKIYKRNPNISLQALILAKHKCEINPEHESFLRRNSNNLYMEPHHLIPMFSTDKFNVSLDREQNIVSLCSNCHNQIHYGQKSDVRSMVEKLYILRKELLTSILGYEITLEQLLELYGIKSN